jgi:diguanylate cyclase (GGDEF)-like protein
MSADDIRPAQRVPPQVRVVVLGIVLIAVALWAVSALPGGTAPLRPAPLWLVVAIIAAFGVVERAVFLVEHRRHSVSVSLSEVPVVLAIALIDVRLAVASRVVLGIVAAGLGRQWVAVKVLVNVGVFAIEIAAAAWLLRVLVDRFGSPDATLVVSAVVATASMSVVGTVLICVAIAQFERSFVPLATAELSHSVAITVLTSTVAGLTLTAVLVSPWLLTIAVIPMVLMWAYVKRQGRTQQALRDVEALHGFAGRIGSLLDLGQIADVAVDETARLVRAESVALMLVRGRVLEVVTHGEPCAALPTAADDPRWVSGREVSGCLEVAGGWSAAISVDGEVLAHLVVAGRDGAQDTFDAVDLRRLRTIADQLAAAIGRGLLHEQLEFEARHDLLTGLANRSTFERRVDALITDVDAGDAVPFVVLFDLDRFKEVNDTLGHHAGDRLLVEVANRLNATASDGDLVARFAGDEFALCGTRPNAVVAELFVERCTTAVSQTFEMDGLEIVVNASAGMAVVRPDDDPPAVLRRADVAMYHAKTNYLGHEVYRSEIDNRVPARLSMLADLRGALDRSGIDLHFQPQLDLLTNTVAGVEVLARWNHPTMGWVPPMDFIKVAEEGGLIRSLTDLALDRSIEAIASVDDRGHRLNLSVNLSALDLMDERLCRRVQAPLERYGMAPERLTLEITEGTVLYDNPRTAALLDRLRSLGVRLSIDDFGTGYSSLSYLRRLPATEVKIDRDFVIDLVPGSPNETIVRSTIDLGHNLGLQVVAEGVETDEVLDHLRSLGCDLAQGYGICRPVALDVLVDWLDSDAAPSPTPSVPQIRRLAAATGVRRPAFAAVSRRTVSPLRARAQRS